MAEAIEVVTTIRINPDRAAEGVALATASREKALTEEGVTRFEVYSNNDAPGVYFFIVGFTNVAAYEAHKNQEHVKANNELLKDWLVAPVDVKVLRRILG
jgi:quinol monooxygenase YgiN